MTNSGFITSFDSSDASSLGIGLLFGDDSQFSQPFKKLVKLAGVTHLVAASGANLRFVEYWPRKLFISFSIRLFQLTSFLVICWYWNMAVQSGSLWRACLMWFLGWLAGWLGRPASPWFTLFFTILLTGLFASSFFSSHGFWLSSLAVVGMSFSQIFPRGEKINRLITHKENLMRFFQSQLTLGSWVYLLVGIYLWLNFGVFEPVGIFTTFSLDSLVPIYTWTSFIKEVINSFGTEIAMLMSSTSGSIDEMGIITRLNLLFTTLQAGLFVVFCWPIRFFAWLIQDFAWSRVIRLVFSMTFVGLIITDLKAKIARFRQLKTWQQIVTS